MTISVGTMVFARHDSSRLPGKALRLLGGIPLLERVIRRAQLLPWPVYLATTDNSSDDPLVELARFLGVESFRGSQDRVLERGVHAAEHFGLDAFARLCGDRPLFPIEALERAMNEMRQASTGRGGDLSLDLVTDYRAGVSVRGLTTEVVRTSALRRILDEGVSDEQQEHMTLYFYEHPQAFRIAVVDLPAVQYACPGFAVDTESDFVNLSRVFGVSTSIDMTVSQADRIFRS